MNKKRFIVVICLLLLSGCYRSPSSSSNTDTQKVYKMHDVVKTDKLSITILNKNTSKNISDYNGLMNYTADGIFLNVSMKIINESDNSTTIDEGKFHLECDGKRYVVTSSIGMSEAKGFVYESFNPGVEINGTIHFDVPESIVNSPNLKLLYGDYIILLNQ